MSMNGLDLSKMSPSWTAAIIICLIGAAVVLEVSDSSNTLVIITVLIGMIGLQQAKNNQVTSRIEEQTNGKTTLRFDRIEDRLANGDRKFDAQAHAIAEVSQQVSAVKAQIEQLVNCETKPEAE